MEQKKLELKFPTRKQLTLSSRRQTIKNLQNQEVNGWNWLNNYEPGASNHHMPILQKQSLASSQLKTSGYNSSAIHTPFPLDINLNMNKLMNPPDVSFKNKINGIEKLLDENFDHSESKSEAFGRTV